MDYYHLLILPNKYLYLSAMVSKGETFRSYINLKDLEPPPAFPPDKKSPMTPPPPGMLKCFELWKKEVYTLLFEYLGFSFWPFGESRDLRF